MNNAERKRFMRAMGIPTKKMKRKRPPDPNVIEAMKQAVGDRHERLEALTGAVPEAGKLWVP